MRFKTEIVLIIILLVIFSLVTVTGIVTYEKLTTIVTKVREEIKPDTRLLTARTLVNSLNDAELNVKSYRITSDTLYLYEFYDAIAKVDSSLSELHSFSLDKTNLDLNDLDTLIDEKLNVLHELMFLQGGERTQKALDRVVDEIEYVDNRVEPQELVTQPEVKQEVIQEKPPEESKDKKRFFKRIFNWKTKKDSVEVEDVPEQVVSQPESQPQLQPLQMQRREVLTIETVNEEVDEIKQDERRFDLEFRAFELALIRKDKAISDKIITFFDDLERFELEEIATESEETENAITKATNQLVLFSIFIGGLLLFMAIMIFNYFRNNNRYKRALRRSEQEAHELADVKEKFLSKMSHEIRTPMNAIIGFTEQVAKGPLSQDQKDHLRLVMDASDHMVFLLNEILDLSKLRADKIELETIPFAPNDVFHNVVAYFKSETKNRPIEIEFDAERDVPSELVGDPYRLRQILYNLSSNALKFTESGSIKLSVTQAMVDGKCWLQIIITDTGKGIAKERIEKIFDEFEQENTSTVREYGGTGLGLAIVRQLVLLSKGQLQLESTLGDGTTVYLSIPYELTADSKVNRMEGSERSQMNWDGFSFLIVDDEPLNRMLLRKILIPLGVALTEAENGLEAVKRCGEDNYDLVLMDVRMPELDGVEATKRIRSFEGDRSNVPVIALTATVSQADRESFIEAGMNGLILKPFKEDEFLKSLKEIIDKLDIQHSMKNKEKKSGLDMTLLNEMSHGDDSFVKDMLKTFTKGLTDCLLTMRQELEKENYNAIADAAHKVAPSCNHMGAVKLYNQLKKLETDIIDKNTKGYTDIQSRIDLIEREMQTVDATIQTELNNS